MATNEIRVGDVGIQLNVTVLDENKSPVDLTLSSLSIVFKRADGTKITATPVFVNNGADGKIKYQFQASDLSVVGPMMYQVKVTTAGTTNSSDIGEIRIQNNL